MKLLLVFSVAVGFSSFALADQAFTTCSGVMTTTEAGKEVAQNLTLTVTASSRDSAMVTVTFNGQETAIGKVVRFDNDRIGSIQIRQKNMNADITSELVDAYDSETKTGFYRVTIQPLNEQLGKSEIPSTGVLACHDNDN